MRLTLEHLFKINHQNKNICSIQEKACNGDVVDTDGVMLVVVVE